MTPDDIAALIRELLELDDFEVDANYFEFGGNSFLLLTLLTQIQQRTGVMLRLIDVVQNPTATALSELLGDQTSDGAAARAR